MQSVVPKQCTALTRKGKRCKRHALLGESHCNLHATPTPKDPPGGGTAGMQKVALDAFFTALLRIAIQTAIDYLHRLYINGALDADPSGITTPEEFSAWYAGLSPSTQERVLTLLAELREERYFEAGGTTSAAS